MARTSATLLPAIAATTMLALGGCVDMFGPTPAPDATRWSGVTTAGAADLPECRPFSLDVALFARPLYSFDTIDGRAYPQASSAGVDTVTTWWVQGYMTPANFVEFETRMQRPAFFNARPYAVWRGTRVDDRIELTESGSPCKRELVLTRS